MKKIIPTILFIFPQLVFAGSGQNINIQIGIVELISIFISLAIMLIVCAWHANGRFTKLETSIEWIKEKLTKHDEDIDNMRAAKALTMSNSPLQLNHDGQKVLNESGILNLIKNNTDKLIKLINDKKPDTAYDVQQNSFTVLKKFISNQEEGLKEIKNYIFNTPEMGGALLNIDGVIYVGSIELRDKYLSKYSELKNTSFDPPKN